MKKMKSLLALITFVIAFTTCTEDDPGAADPADGEPLVTAVGIPAGPLVSGSIDASGGTLSSADGILQLSVPAGAVSASTTFSIQPIVNHCPGGHAVAYRLLPDGVMFSKPVSLTFAYSDSLVADEKFVALAYQGADNTWFSPKSVSLDEGDNTISVQTKHFSDWTVFFRLAIEPLSGSVKINKNLELKVAFVGELNTITDSEGVEINNLNNNTDISVTWEARSGTIKKQGDDGAVYTAPSEVPSPNPVEVSVTFNNVNFIQNGVSFSNPKLITRIRVFGEESIFFVEFRSSRAIQPVGNTWFTETDRGFMKVWVTSDSVRVYDIQNVDAEVLPGDLTDPDSKCKYTLVNAGHGPYHVSSNVSFGGIYSPINNQVYVGISSQTYSKGQNPTFQLTCPGSLPSQIGGGELATAPSQFSFDASKDYQEKIDVIPGGGAFPDGYLKTSITRQ